MTFEANGKLISFCEYTEKDFDSYRDCYNRFYKGRYPHTEYLEKSSLHTILKSGNLLLTLGKLENGTVVSVSAAKRLTGALDGIVLMFMRCVSTDFQSKHVGTNHEKYLLERIKYHFPNTPALQADAVTFDIKSQRTLLQNNFKLCGFCFMMYDSATVLPELTSRYGTRMSFAIYCNPQKTDDVIIYPPEEHKTAIVDIYKTLGIKCIIQNAIHVNDNTEYEIIRYDEHKTAELFIKTPGNSRADEMLSVLNELIKNGYTISGEINMSHQGCTGIYRKLKEIGFYFSGIRPLSKNGQYLVVSQTQNAQCGFETVLLPDEQKKLLQYIINGEKNNE